MDLLQSFRSSVLDRPAITGYNGRGNEGAEAAKNHRDMELSEVRREGEDTIILGFGHLLYFHEDDSLSQDGVGFLVHKTFTSKVVAVSSVSSYLVVMESQIRVKSEMRLSMREAK
ncbi:unnamed protein product [Euphydryas editha]|uniref:Uncharacterized protein n=1 Tax=Euphydryas editha TaxID=104508 RepID=A0AAU9TLI6_EUPED|nr:unnamed protein product [Euphydryas editha]